VNFPDSDTHFDCQQQGHRPRRQSQRQQDSASNFQRHRDVREVSRQANTHHVLLRAGNAVFDLWISVINKQQRQHASQYQQRKWPQAI
jgi:hypothetical protein